jgi:hypothetical protein
MAKIKEVDLGFKRIQKELKELNGSFTKIGIQHGAGKEKTRGNETPQDLLDVAIANEFGTKRIPERSFLRSTIVKKKGKINNFIAHEYSRLLEGKQDTKKGLARVGAFVTGLVQNQIVAIRTPPNAPLTIKLKRSSNPLIDTGTMKNSIRHVEVIKHE